MTGRTIRLSTGADRAARRARRQVVPFWLLQVTELATTVAFADLSIHIDRNTLLLVAGAAFAILAVTAQGPLGIVRVCGRRLHITVVTVVAGLCAMAPVVGVLRPGIEGILILEFGAVGVARLATLTRTDPGRAGSAAPRVPASAFGPGATGPIIDATATETGRDAPPATGVRAAAGARVAGRRAGIASAAVTRSAVQHGPAARAAAKHTIRRAGRYAGRIAKASRSEPEPEEGPTSTP